MFFLLAPSMWSASAARQQALPGARAVWQLSRLENPNTPPAVLQRHHLPKLLAEGVLGPDSNSLSKIHLQETRCVLEAVLPKPASYRYMA